MIWGCIYGNKKGPLVIWDKDNWGKTITGPSYCQFVIIPHLYTFWRELCEKTLDYIYLQQDGAPAHRAKHTTSILRELKMQEYFFDWPANSPDLNSIEHVWRLMKQRIQRRSPHPTTNPVLQQAIHEEWEAITSAEIASMVDSMPLRIQAVLAARGGHTEY